MIEEQYLLTELTSGNREAFTLLFRKYYLDMVLFGGSYLHDKERCEDIAQNVFFKLWSDREGLEITTSIKSFLMKSVKNGCLDELRHKKVIREHEAYSGIFEEMDDLQTENYVLYSDLHAHMEVALKKLPETCRVAFEMNRFEGFKYKEIAQQLEVSERTIEVRIGKAIGLLRLYLKDFYLLLIILLKT